MAYVLKLQFTCFLYSWS